VYQLFQLLSVIDSQFMVLSSYTCPLCRHRTQACWQPDTSRVSAPNMLWCQRHQVSSICLSTKAAWDTKTDESSPHNTMSKQFILLLITCKLITFETTGPWSCNEVLQYLPT